MTAQERARNLLVRHRQQNQQRRAALLERTVREVQEQPTP